MRLWPRILGIVLAAALGVGLVALSDVAMQNQDPDEALLRLSWRAVGRRVEECRAPTAAELESLPMHMRRAEICEGRFEPLKLTLRIDGDRVVEKLLHPAGAREDRPIHVFEEIALAAGEHRVEVEFGAVSEGPEDATRTRMLDERIDAEPGRVSLVTTESVSGELILVHDIPGAPADRG
jgi:hypothetical protein